MNKKLIISWIGGFLIGIAVGMAVKEVGYNSQQASGNYDTNGLPIISQTN